MSATLKVRTERDDELVRLSTDARGAHNRVASTSVTTKSLDRESRSRPSRVWGFGLRSTSAPSCGARRAQKTDERIALSYDRLLSRTARRSPRSRSPLARYVEIRARDVAVVALP